MLQGIIMTTIKEYVTNRAKSQSMTDRQITFLIGNILLRTGTAFDLKKPYGIDCDDLELLLKNCETFEKETKIIPMKLSEAELPHYVLLISERYPNHNC